MLLIEKGADINARNEIDYTPILCASIRGDADFVNMLIDKGADVRDRDFIEKTPLIIAAEEGHLNVVKLLIDKGANVNDSDDHDLEFDRGGNVIELPSVTLL
eukprot:GHVR01084143.1.p2 GENE.GHVR01084143.1~~GHVR01084143.1.p2  ORF type:complete len:102 (+),score=9.36 GHVR01084143.1:857-1162(+)